MTIFRQNEANDPQTPKYKQAVGKKGVKSQQTLLVLALTRNEKKESTE